MKTLFNTSIVLLALSLQSCYSSSGHKLDKPYEHETKHKSVTTFNNVILDTTYSTQVFFISNVDDTEMLAYGRFYQFEQGKSTEVAAAVPYEAIIYDDKVKLHYIDMPKFIDMLNSDHPKANVFIQSHSLVGYKYTNIDKTK
jgi:hypothetical protein